MLGQVCLPSLGSVWHFAQQVLSFAVKIIQIDVLLMSFGRRVLDQPAAAAEVALQSACVVAAGQVMPGSPPPESERGNHKVSRQLGLN